MRKNKNGKFNLYDLRKWQEGTNDVIVYRINRKWGGGSQWIIKVWDKRCWAYIVKPTLAQTEREALEKAYAIVCEGGEA